MKKYLLQKGYKFKENYNDMTDKQFYLSEASYEDSEHSTMGNHVMDMQETYILFLKSFDTSTFKSTIESILDSAITDGLCASLGNSISVEKQENGYIITMNFITRGD